MTSKEILVENGYEDVVVFENYSYDTALIGVSHDNRAIYDWEKMVHWLMINEGFTAEEAMEWIDYNTMIALPYIGQNAPIILFPLYDLEVDNAVHRL